MRTQLDEAMDAKLAQLLGPGSPFGIGSVPNPHGTGMVPVITGVPEALPDYMAHYCDQHRDTVFLVAGEERLTFGQVYEQAQAVARALASVHGVRPGDRVGIAMRNSPSWIALYMAVLMAGGVATLLNGWWQQAELFGAADDVGCGLIFADGPRVRRLEGWSGRVVAVDDTRPLAEAMAPLVEGADPRAELPRVTGQDPATVLFTSGSTGTSKGALSQQRAVLQGVFNYLSQALMMLGLATDAGTPPTSQPSTLLNVPLFHVTAEVPVFLQSFAMGRKLVLMPKWDAEEAMRLIQQEGVTYFVGVPLMSFEILTHPRRADYDLSTVTDFAAGGAPRPAEHVQRIEAEMGGSAPLIGYGLTETNGVGTGNWRTNYTAKPDSAGRPSLPLVDLAILDDDGAPVPQGERGEVCIRTICNFTEYWGRSDDTARAFTADGYFRTGDLGYLDPEGYLFIVDRKKDIIIRGGENISCLEVEAELYACPDVAEAAVFGLPDERFGEVPGAVVEPRDGVTLTEDALRAFLSDRIAAFKVPARIWIVDEPLPRLGTEKIDKVSLKRKYRALAGA